MSRIFRIFAKDVRHLWPEILISLTLTAGYAVTDHLVRQPAANRIVELREWTQVLMPVMWWFLVSRTVHDEPLVGDRQFWTTRPYGWYRVLAAKFFFIATFILVPFLAAQAFILHQARLYPSNVLPGLLFTLTLLFGFFLLPLWALSAITSSITRVFIILLALAIYAGMLFYLMMLAGAEPRWEPGGTSFYALTTLLALPFITGFVVVLQYVTRRTRLSVAGLLLFVVAISVAVNADYRWPSHGHTYTTLGTGEPPPFAVTVNPDPKFQHPMEFRSAQNAEPLNERSVSVPLILSGIAPGHVVRIDAEALSVAGDGIAETESYWVSETDAPYSPDTPASSIWIRGWMAHMFDGKLARIHLNYALTEFELVSTATRTFQNGSVDVPQNGRCMQESQYSEVVCHYALTGPDVTRVAYTLGSSCAVGSADAVPVARWIGTDDRPRRNLDLSPVDTVQGALITNDMVTQPPGHYHLCPGSQMTFATYKVVRKRKLDVWLPPLDLQLYTQRSIP